ncbi:MAG: DinB family protein [Gelidibacter sp.]
MTSKDLRPTEYNPYYKTYLNQTKNLDLKTGLPSNHEQVLAFLKAIPKEKQEYRYAEGKWTIKEVLLHIIDTERIFAYRALRIARQDQTPLQGFDQDDYVAPSKANRRSFESLLNEYKAVRQATIALFDSFDDEMLVAIGTASNSPISVRALGFIIMGHENHHCEVVRERYL